MRTLYAEGGKKTLVQQAYDHIRNEIITLRLLPGQLISENEMAGALGMSRTPVREALRTLVEEDLLEVLPQRGVRIALLSEKKAEDSRFVRESLETSAFRQVAGMWREDDPACRETGDLLKELIREQREAALENDAHRFLELDEQFHKHILLLTGNDTLVTVVFHMRAHLNRLRYLMLQELGGMQLLTDDHERIVAAIGRNDEAETVRLMERHLRKMSTELPLVKERLPDYFNI